MTEPHRPISEEALHAWVDGEYTPEDSAELLAALQRDRELLHHAADIRMLKESVRLAYRQPPQPPVNVYRAARQSSVWRSLAAGILVLAIGVLLGWSMHPIDSAGRFVLLDPIGTGQQSAAAGSEATRIVFHLTNPDMAVAEELLDEIDAMLTDYRDQGSELRVEVVAHGDGLGLLRERLSRHRDRIRSMSEQNPNLTFVACKNTIDRLRVERGVEVVLLPDAHLTGSGVNHVVRRQHQGWVYIKV